MIPERLRNALSAVAARQDLALVVLLVMTIFMMILPLPTVLVDGLIALNMALTVLLLMVGIYLRDPLEFSTLPSVILISTLFRLSLSITTTRLILTEADAGAIVETFGSFVIGGNLVVGMVVFLIITVVQFLVITKGSERIAEVSARFSLDALPGKQMSIDADLRNSAITMDDARRRRHKLEKESQLYGAMDGAMKFVKGDAIAGLVIIAVNLLGGLAIGVVQRGMPLGEALQVYALLTVGDGLVAQIPALFLSITAGAIVTRVTSEESRNLGSDISGQLIHNPQTLRLAALVLVFFALIPGFPTAIFLLLAALFGGAGLLYYLRDRKAQREAEEARARGEGGEDDLALPPGASVSLQLAPDLHQRIDARAFAEAARRLRRSLYQDLGVPFPGVALERDPGLAEGGFRVGVEDIPVSEGRLRPDHLLLRDDPAHADLLGVETVEDEPLVPDLPTLWVEARHREALKEAGVAHLDLQDVALLILATTMTRYASHFLGIQETRALIGGMERHYSDLVKEAQKAVPIQKTAEILRRLVDEGVSVRNLRVVLEALVEWGHKEKDVALLAEYVRAALKRQISHRYADRQKTLPAYMLEPEVEQAVRDAIRHTSVGAYLALDDATTQRILAQLREETEKPSRHRHKPVILSSLDVRRFVRNLLVSNDLDLPVLSYQELAPEVTVRPLGSIALAAPAAAE